MTISTTSDSDQLYRCYRGRSKFVLARLGSSTWPLVLMTCVPALVRVCTIVFGLIVSEKFTLPTRAESLVITVRAKKERTSAGTSSNYKCTSNVEQSYEASACFRTSSRSLTIVPEFSAYIDAWVGQAKQTLHLDQGGKTNAQAILRTG